MNTQPESLRLAHVADHPIPPDWIDMVAAVRELLRLHAENEALQQVYDATQLEIDHLRGATKTVELAQPVAQGDGEVIYRWRALDYSGFCYGSNHPDNLPQSADLTAFYRQPDAFRAALDEISATGNLTATPQQFIRHLQKIATDALAARSRAKEGAKYG